MTILGAGFWFRNLPCSLNPAFTSSLVLAGCLCGTDGAMRPSTTGPGLSCQGSTTRRDRGETGREQGGGGGKGGAAQSRLICGDHGCLVCALPAFPACAPFAVPSPILPRSPVAFENDVALSLALRSFCTPFQRTFLKKAPRAACGS